MELEATESFFIILLTFSKRRALVLTPHLLVYSACSTVRRWDGGGKCDCCGSSSFTATNTAFLQRVSWDISPGVAGSLLSRWWEKLHGGEPVSTAVSSLLRAVGYVQHVNKNIDNGCYCGDNMAIRPVFSLFPMYVCVFIHSFIHSPTQYMYTEYLTCAGSFTDLQLCG